MPDFAIHDGYTVVNVVVADSAEIAEVVTGLHAFETDGVPWLGWTLESEGWRRPAPFPSWTWDGSDYVAPVSDPGDGSYWDEGSLSWVAPAPVEPVEDSPSPGDDV